MAKAKKFTQNNDGKNEMVMDKNAFEKMELKSADAIYKEDPNILVATWFNNLGLVEKSFEEKWLFYNSERLLNK